MKYVANPVVVDAFKIIEIGTTGSCGTAVKLSTDDPIFDHWENATPEMTARITPQVGDYWVIQSDGYVYLNPKEVFERKYRPLEQQEEKRT